MRIADVADQDGDGYPEILTTNGSKWTSYDVRNLNAPIATALKIGSPSQFPVVCDPPNYYQFGTPAKPASASNRSAFLTWITPVTRENGEALCAHELAGYHIYYKGSSPKHVLRGPHCGRASRFLAARPSATQPVFVPDPVLRLPGLLQQILVHAVQEHLLRQALSGRAEPSAV